MYIKEFFSNSRAKKGDIDSRYIKFKIGKEQKHMEII